MNNLFETKNKIVYPKILNDEIKLLSFNKNDSKLIGSASYKIQKYPADIDLYEEIKICCSKEEAIEYFYLGIKNIVNRIRILRNHWVIEVKCGIDNRYVMDENMSINQKIMYIHSIKNILSETDYKNMIELLELSKSDNRMNEILDELIRKYKIIRWSSSDIEAGVKIKNGKKFYLKDCIDTHSPINIEIIAVINNKFSDLSNFFVLVFHDKLTDKDYVINFPQDYLTEGTKFTRDGLKQGINKVLFSNINKDVFKGVKRMFSLARISNDKQLLNKIKPIISSDLSELSQIKSELGTINEILNFTDSIPYNVLYSQLDSIKWRIGGNLELDNDQILFLSEIINNIINNKYDIQYIINETANMKKYILDIVNYKTEKYLRRINLFKKF